MQGIGSSIDRLFDRFSDFLNTMVRYQDRLSEIWEPRLYVRVSYSIFENPWYIYIYIYIYMHLMISMRTVNVTFHGGNGHVLYYL
jgi:hypothetical protein